MSGKKPTDAPLVPDVTPRAVTRRKPTGLDALPEAERRKVEKKCAWVREKLQERFGEKRPQLITQLMNLVVPNEDKLPDAPEEEDVIQLVRDLLQPIQGGVGHFGNQRLRVCTAVIAAELRVQALTWQEIAYVCGYSSQQAALQAVRALRHKFARDAVEELKEQDNARIDKMLAVYTPLAEAGDTKAAEIVHKFVTQRAALNGTNAPAKKSVDVRASINSDKPADLTDAQLAAIIGAEGGDAEDKEEMSA